MKKVATFLSVIFFFIAFLIITPFIIEGFAPKVTATKLRNITYIDSVVSMGEIAQENQQVIQNDIPVIIDKVLVKSGDTIKEGDTVATVNKEATAKKYMDLNLSSTIASSLAGSIALTSYDEIYASIPQSIVSNIGGVINYVSVNDGDFVNNKTTIASMIGSDNLIVNASINENFISNVELGQKVVVTGTGFAGKTYLGEVSFINPVAKKQYTGTVQETVVDVKIKLTNADSKIKSGYSATARILTSNEFKMNIIPYEAIMQDNSGKQYVYIYNNGKAIKKEIQTGMEINEGVQVVSGLSNNDVIITSPLDIKDEGQLIKIAG